MKNIRVGVIGLGVGIKHLNVLSKIKFCSIIAVCDFNKKKLNSLKFKNQEIIKTTNYKDLLKMKLDLVIIASYDNFHSKQIIKFVKIAQYGLVELWATRRYIKVIFHIQPEKSLTVCLHLV